MKPSSTLCYASAGFARKYGAPFDYANITDVPTFTWSYPSILSAAGIHEPLWEAIIFALLFCFKVI